VFAEQGFHAARLEDVAVRAGITRKTVYNQFGSKFGLLEALLSELEGRTNVGSRIQAALDLGQPDRALRAYFREACRFWSADQAVLRNLLGAAATGVEALHILEGHDLARKRRLTSFVSRLAAQGRLRVLPQDALEALWFLGSFPAFDHLARRSSLPASKVARILTSFARTLLRQAGRQLRIHGDLIQSRVHLDLTRRLILPTSVFSAYSDELALVLACGLHGQLAARLPMRVDQTVPDVDQGKINRQSWTRCQGQGT
jgi:AcrR family transcriptional regulator